MFDIEISALRAYSGECYVFYLASIHLSFIFIYFYT
jgi:hypothetical protein